MNERYVLDENGQPRPCEDLMEWARWFQNHENHRVAEDVLPGNVRISTVFLGLDHRFGGRGLPILWETMIFGGPHDEHQERYTTRDAALEGHARAVALASAP